MATAPTRKPKKRLTALQSMEKAGPSRAKLRRLAKRKSIPQSWFEQTDNPFKAEKE